MLMRVCRLWCALLVDHVFMMQRKTLQKKIKAPDLSLFLEKPLRTTVTRSSVDNVCDCYLCTIARKPWGKLTNFAKGDVPPPRMSISSDPTITSTPSKSGGKGMLYFF